MLCEPTPDAWLRCEIALHQVMTNDRIVSNAGALRNLLLTVLSLPCALVRRIAPYSLLAAGPGRGRVRADTGAQPAGVYRAPAGSTRTVLMSVS